MSSSAPSLFDAVYTVGGPVALIAPNPATPWVSTSVRYVAVTVWMDRVDGESMSFVLIGTGDSKE